MKLEQNSEAVVLNRAYTLNNVNDATELMQRNCRIQYSLVAAKLNTASLMKKQLHKKIKHAFWGISRL